MPNVEIIRSGDGWEVWEQGELHYNKSGDMSDCTEYSRPWGSKFFSAIIASGVTRIGNYAFCNCGELVYVEIPQSVRTIGNYAFYNCDSLERVTIPEGVESIGEYAFNHCYYLTEIVLPASLTSIGEGAFWVVGSDAVERKYQLVDVYYAGTQAQWNAITKGASNHSLNNATIHYNSSGFSGTIPKLPIAQLNNPLGFVVKHLNTVIRELNPVLEDIDNKQDKETGKGLSTNDYTTAEKTKLSGIEAQANKTIIDTTLSHTGQAADAKATGDSLSALRNLLSRMEIHCEASGNPAIFSDAKATNVRDLTVTITPTQSGSGDPYPPGGGKNKLFIEDYESSLYSGIQHKCINGVVSVIGTATRAFPISLTTNVNSLPAGNYTIINSGTLNEWWFLYNNTTGSDLASKSTPTFTYNGTDNIVLKCGPVPVGKAVNGTYKFMLISEGETDTSYAPYSNIRPISGVSSVSVTRNRKNLFNPSGLITTSDTWAGTPWTVDADGIYSGLPGRMYNLYGPSKGYKPLPPLKANTRYTLSFDGRTDVSAPGFGLTLGFKYTDGTTSSGALPARADFTHIVLTSLEGKSVATFFLSFGNDNTSYIRNIQLEEGNTATNYEACQGASVIVPLVDSNSNPLTVYGGALDVTTGQLSVTWANIASYNGETLPGRWISDRDVYAPGATPTTGAQVVYELATPLTYQLTAQQLATFHGYNTVSSDAGSVSVTYKADTALSLGGGT